jgi:hypothetical protein
MPAAAALATRMRPSSPTITIASGADSMIGEVATTR